MINTSGIAANAHGMATVIWPNHSEAEAKQQHQQRAADTSDSGMSSHENSPSPGSLRIEEQQHAMGDVTAGTKRRRSHQHPVNENEQAGSGEHTPLDFSIKRSASTHQANGRSHSLDHYADSALARQHRLLSSLLPGIHHGFNQSSAFQPVQHHANHLLPGILSGLLPPLPTITSAAGTLPIVSQSLAVAPQQHQQLTPPMKHTESMESLVSVGSETTTATGSQQQQQKQRASSVRPFKAYNPQDPLSALQLPCNDAQTSANNELLLAQYRQLMQTKTTPSPPQFQVTSTSHPHTAEGAAAAARGRLASNDVSNASHLPICAPVIRPLKSGSHPTSVIVNNPEKPSTPAAGDNGDALEAEQAAVAANSAGSSSSSQRAKGKSLPDEQKDDAYWERRRKNNEAAKRSRDARRCKEDEIAMRAALLEQENLRLRIELAQLKQDCDRMRAMLLNV